MNGQCVVKKITGTGSAINVSLSFTPIAALAINETDAKMFWWFGGSDGQTAAYAWQLVDSGSGTTDMSELTSGGFTAYAGSATTSAGLTLGTTIATSGDTIRLVVWRGVQDV